MKPPPDMLKRKCTRDDHEDADIDDGDGDWTTDAPSALDYSLDAVPAERDATLSAQRAAGGPLFAFISAYLGPSLAPPSAMLLPAACAVCGGWMMASIRKR